MSTKVWFEVRFWWNRRLLTSNQLFVRSSFIKLQIWDP